MSTDPGTDVDRPAARASLLGGSIAARCPLSGGLVAWDPLPSGSALLLPFLSGLAFDVVHLVAVLVLHAGADPLHLVATCTRRRSPRRRRHPLVDPRRAAVLAATGCCAASPWSRSSGPSGIGGLRDLTVRLSEILGGEEQAGALMGPVPPSAGESSPSDRPWPDSPPPDSGHADGDPGAGPQRPRRGRDGPGRGPGRTDRGLPRHLRTARVRRAVTNSLLHREARAGNRATVLSMNSMVGLGSLRLVAGAGAPG